MESLHLLLDRAREIDRALLLLLHRDLATRPTEWLARLVDPPAALAVFVALAAFVAWLASGRRPRAVAAVLAAVVAAGGIGAAVLKPALARPRPATAIAELHAETLPADAREGLSFPSTHATVAFAAAAAVLLVAGRRAGALALLAAALVAASRVAIGMHYPSDVLAGAALGCACGAAAWRLLPGRVKLPQP